MTNFKNRALIQFNGEMFGLVWERDQKKEGYGVFVHLKEAEDAVTVQRLKGEKALEDLQGTLNDLRSQNEDAEAKCNSLQEEVDGVYIKLAEEKSLRTDLNNTCEDLHAQVKRLSAQLSAQVALTEKAEERTRDLEAIIFKSLTDNEAEINEELSCVKKEHLDNLVEKNKKAEAVVLQLKACGIDPDDVHEWVSVAEMQRAVGCSTFTHKRLSHMHYVLGELKGQWFIESNEEFTTALTNVCDFIEQVSLEVATVAEVPVEEVAAPVVEVGARSAKVVGAVAECLQDAVKVLRGYQQYHEAKGTEDSLRKAAVNRDLSNRFEEALNDYERCEIITKSLTESKETVSETVTHRVGDVEKSVTHVFSNGHEATVAGLKLVINVACAALHDADMPALADRIAEEAAKAMA